MARQTYLYVGCSTRQSSIGIHVYDSSDLGGALCKRGEFEGVEHPSFLVAHPSAMVLYAVSEVAGPDGGEVVALRIDPDDGSLVVIDRAPSLGSAPCHLSVDDHGRYLYVANYLSGTVAVYAVEPDAGLGELIATHQHSGSGPSARQEGPHAHCIVPGPVADSVYAVDLGADRVVHYVHDRGREAEAFALGDEFVVDPGAGPRHLAFHPRLPLGFLVCELDSTLVTLGVDPVDGRLTRLGSVSTLPTGFGGESIAAEVRVHQNGRFVYVSNRGHDSIAVFGFTGAGESLVPLAHVHSGGRTPRSFALHPSGRAAVVANQDSDNVIRFEVDGTSGVLHQLDGVHHASRPVCVTFKDVV